MKQQALLHLKAHKISALFTLWDGDCAGSLNVTELELVVSKWSGFSSKAQSAGVDSRQLPVHSELSGKSQSAGQWCNNLKILFETFSFFSCCSNGVIQDSVDSCYH